MNQQLSAYHIVPTVNDPKEEGFEKTLWGKRENAGNQHFIFFPLCYLRFPRQISIYESHLFCRLQILSIWTRSKILSLGKELSNSMLDVGDHGDVLSPILQEQSSNEILIFLCSTLSSIYTHSNTLKKKIFGKALWKKVKLLKMSNFTFSHNVFYAICILESFNSHILVVVCSFLEFETVSKWCIRERVNRRVTTHVKQTQASVYQNLIR